MDKEFLNNLKFIDEINDLRFGIIKLYQHENHNIFSKTSLIKKENISNFKDIITKRLRYEKKFILKLIDYRIENFNNDYFNITGFYEYYNVFNSNFNNFEELKRFFDDILTSWNYMQLNNIIHGDIRPEYIINDNISYKLCDRLINNSPPLKTLVYNIKNNKELYIPYKLFEKLINNDTKELNYNIFSLEVYSLCLLVLRISLNKSIQFIYNGNFEVYIKCLSKLIQELKSKFGNKHDKLYKVLEKILLSYNTSSLDAKSLYEVYLNNNIIQNSLNIENNIKINAKNQFLKEKNLTIQTENITKKQDIIINKKNIENSKYENLKLVQEDPDYKKYVIFNYSPCSKQIIIKQNENCKITIKKNYSYQINKNLKFKEIMIKRNGHMVKEKIFCN